MKCKNLIAIIISTIIILLDIWFIFGGTKDFSEYENRYLEKLPKINIDKILNGKYMEKLELYMQDQFPLRNTFMGLKTSFDKYTFKTKINGVYLGKDNYLIEEFKEPKNSDKIIKSLNEFYEKNSNINFNLMIVPTSIEINKDKLPKYIDDYSEIEMIDYIYSNINFNSIDVYQTLLSNNKNYQMFYYLDHHWTTYGAYYAYLEFAKLNDINALSMNEFNIIKVCDDFNGTLYSKSNDYTRDSDSIYIFDKENDLTVEYLDTKVVTNTLYEEEYLLKKDKYSLFLDNNHSLIVVTNNNIDNDNEIIVIKDSYANSFIPFLVNHYKKVHVVDPRYYTLSITDYIKLNNNIKDGLILYNANNIDSDIGILGIE